MKAIYKLIEAMLVKMGFEGAVNRHGFNRHLRVI